MASIDEKIAILIEKKSKVIKGGGEKEIEKQHQKGRHTARERIEMLFDKDTFYEYDMFIKNRCTDFNFGERDIPGEGVVTGHGEIDGRLVYVFSQDFTVFGGTLGEAHADKIVNVMEKAIENGAPIIGINDSGGARIQEGMGALHGYGRIFFDNSMASGIVPQISIIMGLCAGGAVYSPALTDFVFMVDKTSNMFITGPEVIKAVTGEKVSNEELGGAKVHNIHSGAAHFIAETERQCIEMVKQLLTYIPSNSSEKPPIKTTRDKIDRIEERLQYIVPDNPKRPYDVKEIIRLTVDEGEFLEVHALYAENAVVGMARLNGMSVGIIANQPKFMAGSLDIKASGKIARFVRFCDAFNIPLLSLVDVPGYLPGVKQEHGGIIRIGAQVLYAYSEATVPKVTVVLRKDYGGTEIAMCSKALGADYIMAFPTAEIAVMGAEGAVNIIYKRDIEKQESPETFRQQKIDEYRNLYSTPYKAAEWGMINEVINPAELRFRLIKVFDSLKNKNQECKYRRRKKHCTLPL